MMEAKGSVCRADKPTEGLICHGADTFQERTDRPPSIEEAAAANHPGSPYARLATKPSSARRCPTASGASSPPRTKCTIFVNEWPRPYATSSPSSADGPQYDPPPSCRPCTPPRLVRLVPLRRALLHSFNIQANLRCPPSSSAAFAMTPCSLQLPSSVSTNFLVSLVAPPLP